MTLRINKEAGKGSNRRATQDDNTYRSNYDLIFRKDPDDDKKYKVEPEVETVVTDKATWEIKPRSKILRKKPSFVTIKDAPSVLNLQDQAMWVIGYNEAITVCNEYYKGVW